MWGCADLMSDVYKEDFDQRMKLCLGSMAGPELFPFESCFDMDLPQQRLKGDVPEQKMKEAIAAARLKDPGQEALDIFLDTSTSRQRNPEFAMGVSTCVRPTHAVYSSRLQRYLNQTELWRCQGLFENAFMNPQAVQKMMGNAIVSQDLAGNSFASTTCQVNLLASLAHATGWGAISDATDGVAQEALRPMYMSHQKRPLDDAMVPAAQRVKRCDVVKRDRDDSAAGEPVRKRFRSKKSDSDNAYGPAAHVEKLLEQAQSGAIVSAEHRGRGRPCGAKNQTGQRVAREGKSVTLSIAQKLAIIREYENIKAVGKIKHVEKWMLLNGRMRGGYQGCLSKSKWLGSREKYKWDSFAVHCPQLAKKKHEVPNALREVLGVEGKKYEHGSFKQSGPMHYLPYALEQIFENVMLSRQSVGEENDIIFASNLLDELIRVWNDNINQLIKDVRTAVSEKALAAMDGVEDEAMLQEAAEVARKAIDDATKELRTIDLKQNAAARRCGYD